MTKDEARRIVAGKLLLEAKALVKHGEWLPCLESHCQIPELFGKPHVVLHGSRP